MAGPMCTIATYPFAELPPRLAYQIWQLRQAVFVVEQDCPYADLDGRDTEDTALHLVATEGDTLLGCVRVLQDRDEWRIGRVATTTAARGRGIGAALMQAAVDQVGEPIVLDAQAHLEQWYARFGFTSTGREFLEDGIPHVEMRR